MVRVPRRSIVALGLMLSSIGCGSAPQIEFSATPQLVCAGDIVHVRLVSVEGHSEGRITVAPDPLASTLPVALAFSDGAIVYEHDAQICESTTFTATLWNGEETTCGADYTTCASELISVPFGDLPIRQTSATCGESATFDLSSEEFGSLRIREVLNCTAEDRPVLVTAPDGTVAEIPGSGASSAFAGQDLVGSFTAQRTLIPPERCPPEFETVPGPLPPAPPAICLVFVAGCDGSDDCPGA